MAEPAAWLAGDGFEVVCLDLSLQKLAPAALAGAGLVAFHLGMHTATRIAVEALPRVRELAPGAHLCAYGLYAPVNAALLRRLGVGTILGGEAEPLLLDLARQARDGAVSVSTEPRVHLGRIPFLPPDRSGLPPLSRYAHLELPDGSTRVVGFVEASRGCKHLCRHCPVVPVYGGRFRVVPADTVLADLRAQVAAGAGHVSFGDPDFLNGPTHALRIVAALHAEFPDLTFDCTVKIQHLLAHADSLLALKRAGCLFITSAVEAVDDEILGYLAKNHTGIDFERAVALTRAAGIALAPTFVAFTPWTSLEGYLDLLQRLVDLQLVEAVPPVQLAIRLLVPQGSRLLELPGFRARLDDFDEGTLGYPWRHRDARVDELQKTVEIIAARAGSMTRRAAFEETWSAAHAALGRAAPALPRELGTPIPRLSEPWYCCAEPTGEQLRSF